MTAGTEHDWMSVAFYELIVRHLSPGGSADLLGVTWFLAQFPPMHEGD
jgi:hypothetical protein